MNNYLDVTVLLLLLLAALTKAIRSTALPSTPVPIGMAGSLSGVSHRGPTVRRSHCAHHTQSSTLAFSTPPHPSHPAGWKGVNLISLQRGLHDLWSLYPPPAVFAFYRGQVCKAFISWVGISGMIGRAELESEIPAPPSTALQSALGWACRGGQL